MINTKMHNLVSIVKQYDTFQSHFQYKIDNITTFKWFSRRIIKILWGKSILWG